MPEVQTLARRTRALAGWALAPATDEVPRPHAIGAAALRILLGLMWLYNVSWKHAPDFGRSSGSGLYKFTSYAVSDPVFPPFSWVIEHLVLPHFAPFGWSVLVLETLLAVLLLSGTFVRVAGALGLAQSVAIALSTAHGPHEWPWSYWLMIGAHLMVLVGAGGRVVAVDAVRAGITRPVVLARFWGGVAVVLGLYSALASLTDPLDARGPGLISKANSISLGEYNLLGGVALLAVAVLLLLGRPDRTAPWLTASTLAVLAALSLHAQLGNSDPVLGGTPVSAAMFLTLAAVAGSLGLASRRIR